MECYLFILQLRTYFPPGNQSIISTLMEATNTIIIIKCILELDSCQFKPSSGGVILFNKVNDLNSEY